MSLPIAIHRVPARNLYVPDARDATCTSCNRANFPSEWRERMRPEVAEPVDIWLLTIPIEGVPGSRYQIPLCREHLLELGAVTEAAFFGELDAMRTPESDLLEDR